MKIRHVDPLATVYAEALADIAEARGGKAMLGEIGEAISGLGQAWADRRNLRAYFLSAMVPREEKQASLAKLLADFPPLFVDFIHLLLRRGRGRIIDKVAIAYDAILDERLGRVQVTLTTATDVESEKLAAWMEQLREAVGKEPIISHVVQPELVAGATLQVGDTIADGSARRQLAEFKQQVRERGKHALQA